MAYIPRMKNRGQRGFTVYELLITLLIVGVVLTLGIPNLSEFTQNSRVTSVVNDLHSSFLLARSEAARAKANVTICASASPMDAAADCDGGSFDEGWIIFVDLGNPNLIARDVPGTEPILRRHPAIPDGIDITPLVGGTYFSFAPSGLGRGDVDGPALQSAVICDERGNRTASGGLSAARYIVVTPIGRSTVVREVGQIALAIDDEGVCL
jgi:type IV fimbrial biogenesis protein FimT